MDYPILIALAEKFGIAMVFALLFWGFARRSENRAEAREIRMDDELKRVHEKTENMLDGTIRENTKVLEGIKNGLEVMSTRVSNLQFHCEDVLERRIK